MLGEGGGGAGGGGGGWGLGLGKVHFFGGWSFITFFCDVGGRGGEGRGCIFLGVISINFLKGVQSSNISMD